MTPEKSTRFSSAGLAAGLLLPSYCAAADTTFHKLVGLFAAPLLFLLVLAGILGLLVVAGHYGFKANPVLTGRICYSLGAILVAKAIIGNHLPTTASTGIALAASALTYFVLARFRPDS